MKKIKMKKTNEQEAEPRKNKSITMKITLALFVMFFIALLFMGILISTTVNSKFTENEKEILEASSEGVSNKANAFFEKYIGIVLQIGQDKNLQQFLIDVKGRDTLLETEGFMTAALTLKETVNSDPDVILGAFIAEKDYYLSSPTAFSDFGFDTTTRSYYKSISEGIICITDPYIDAITGKTVITISAPVKVNGKIEGLAAVDISTDNLSKIVSGYKTGETGYFTLITENNIVAAHRDSDNILKPIDEIELSDNMIQLIKNKSGNVSEYTYKDEKLIGNSIAIGNTGWRILSSMTMDEFESNTKQIILNIVITFVLALVLLLIVMALLISKMTKPIKKITEITNRLAEGQLDVDIDIKSSDEIGALAKSIESLTFRLKSYIAYIDESVDVLDEMAEGNLAVELKNDYAGEFAKLKGSLLNVSETLKSTIGKIKESADSINMNAEHVSSGAQILAQGTTEQASAIEELSAEINEIYQTIVSNAEYAENAGSKALEASREVESGNAQMRDMLSAMDEISNSSSEIGKIIKVIDDIAFQTNILALNAAVEAARAGSAGKGFAVVADEVRNLAGKSAEAAKQTTSLIENSINAIRKGTLLADGAGRSLAGIVSKTNETNEIINEIVKASSHQTISVNQIRSGIEQISSVVQENAATAEASAANSEELSGQAHILNDLVGRFNTDSLAVNK